MSSSRTDKNTSSPRTDAYLNQISGYAKQVGQYPQMFEDVKSFEDLIGNKPIFTRKLLETAAADIEKARNRKTCTQPIIVPHVVGKGSQTFTSGETCSRKGAKLS
jgi:hypothetical protein